MPSFTDLHPSFRPLAEKTFQAAQAAGLKMVLIETVRSLADQQTAYDEGRSKARPGQSPHQFGLAFDAAPTATGKLQKSDWKNSKAFKSWGQIVLAHGLTWGGTFTGLNDGPHAELPGWKKLIGQSGAVVRSGAQAVARAVTKKPGLTGGGALLLLVIAAVVLWGRRQK